MTKGPDDAIDQLFGGGSNIYVAAVTLRLTPIPLRGAFRLAPLAEVSLLCGADHCDQLASDWALAIFRPDILCERRRINQSR